ncbi:MAG: glycosyltransferase [Prevotella sp.]|nr:glycosyltransferase [Prevotella sp.]
MKIIEYIKHIISPKVQIPDSFSEERYATAYPDCNGKAKQHYRQRGMQEGRICYISDDMGKKKANKTDRHPLISIIVTSYNYERYIVQTLDSLVNQTYDNVEIIIVDDNSQDSSVEIIKKYTEDYPNIRLLTHSDGQNHGLPESMLLGIKNAKGEYVAFCESDDYLHSEYIQQKIHIINTYEDVVIISNAIKMFGDPEDIKAREWVCSHIRKLLKQGGTPIDLRYNQEFNFIPTLSSIMIRTDVIKSLNYDTPVSAWIDFWIYRQILIKYPLYFVDKELTFWRQHNSYNGLSESSKRVNQLEDFLKKSNILIGI